MPRTLVIFDGDDTLWLVEHLYDEARGAAAQIVTHAGLNASEWEALQRRIDVENVVRFGVRAERFPTSCVEAYRQVAVKAEAAVLPDVVGRIWKAAASVYERQATPVQDVDSVLNALRPDCTLVLLTKGEDWVQRKRLADAGLEGRFDHVAITPAKYTAEFVRLLKRFNTDAQSAWSVGNSLASDINPALAIGMSAVWIDAHVWEHERRETTPVEGRLFVAERLSAVPKVILAR